MKKFFVFVVLCAVAIPVSAADWTLLSEGNVQSLSDITVSGDNLVAVGNTGNVIYSEDNGTTWMATNDISSSWLHGVGNMANGDVIAVGEGGAMMISTNNGKTWSPASSGSSENLYDIDIDGATGYIVGANGAIIYLSSVTGWSTVTSNTSLTLHGVHDLGDGKTAWAVGAEGITLYSANAGISWSDQGKITVETLRDVLFTSTSHGFVVGSKGTFLETSDAGNSWTAVSVDGLSNQTLYQIESSADSIVVSGEGIIITSTDGGETWEAETFDGFGVRFYGVYNGGTGSTWVVGTADDVTSLVYYDTPPVILRESEESEDPSSQATQDDASEPPEALPGQLIKTYCDVEATVNDPCKAVYFYSSEGKRHAFPNEKIFFTWYDGFDTVVEVTKDFMASLPLGKNVTYRPGVRMVKFLSVPTVYAVAQKGMLRAIASEQVATGLYGTDWNQQIDDIPDAFYGNYGFGDAIESMDDYSATDERAQAVSLDQNF